MFILQVTDLYDEIVDSKNSLGLALSQKGLLNFHHTNGGNQMPLAKRARLDVNYSISPAAVVQNLGHHQQQNHQNRRKMQLVNRIA